MKIFFGKYKSLFILILTLCPSVVFAQANSSCSSVGYTVATINGINTTEQEARDNVRALHDQLGLSWKGQDINYQYLYNPTHTIIGDAMDSFNQKYDDQSESDLQDSDFAQILTDASTKITTQKLLLVGHSQGNFYANTFYDDVIDAPGGIPSESMGVYSVATPASRVAGNGLYLTSDTDHVIAKLPNILKPNVHIDFNFNDDGGLGHDFSKIYLNYEGDRIVSDIQTSLDKLKDNNVQSADAPCINPPKLTLAQKVQGTMLAVVDPVALGIQDIVFDTATGVYDTALAVENLFIPNQNVATALNAIDQDSQTLPQTIDDSSSTDATQNSTLDDTTQIANENQNSVPPMIVFIPDSSSTVSVADSTITSSPDSPDDSIPENTDDTSGGISGNIGGTSPSSSSLSSSSVPPTPTSPVIPVVPPIVDPPDVIPPMTISTSDLDNDGIPDDTESDVVMTSNMSLPAGEYHFNNLTITNNAQLEMEGDPSSSNIFKGVKIVANNIIVNAGSYIRADGEGYATGTGIGAPSGGARAGASYGGLGASGLDGSNPASTYGSATMPIDLGSSGNRGGSHGGGAIRLVVLDTLQNDGIISAIGDGTASGGSIYVTTNNLAGAGSFDADGGGEYCPGVCYSPGGGGRIAIYYQNSSFIGGATASRSVGTSGISGNGTVGFFDMSHNTLQVEKYWKFETIDSPFSFNHIILENGADVTAGDNVNISSNDLLVDQNSNFTLLSNQTLTIPTIAINRGSTLNLSGSETLNTGTLNVNNSSNIYILPGHILSLTISNINLDATSKISADAAGYGFDAGPGAPSLGTEAGASYGGLGAVGQDASNPSAIYGSDVVPVDFGSGGNKPQTGGGGAIRLIVSGILQNDGLISASGDNTSSGGSIYVTTNNVMGTGIFKADGGAEYCPGVCYGAGGGGRIAIYYQNNSFTGAITADGSVGTSGASADGTVITAVGP